MSELWTPGRVSRRGAVVALSSQAMGRRVEGRIEAVALYELPTEGRSHPGRARPPDGAQFAAA